MTLLEDVSMGDSDDNKAVEKEEQSKRGKMCMSKGEDETEAQGVFSLFIDFLDLERLSL